MNDEAKTLQRLFLSAGSSSSSTKRVSSFDPNLELPNKNKRVARESCARPLMAGVKAFCVVLYLCPRSCRGLAAAGKQEGTLSCYQEIKTAFR